MMWLQLLTFNWPQKLGLYLQISFREFFQNGQTSSVFSGKEKLFSGTNTEFYVLDHTSQAAIMAKFRAFMLNPDLYRTFSRYAR